MTTQRERQKVWKERHIKALEELGFKASQFNRLRQLENEAHRFAEKYCNGEIDGDTWEKVDDWVIKAVEKLAGKSINGLFVNGDPRGYALKIDPGQSYENNYHPEYIPEGMHRDWGGYGILAPEEF